MRGWLVTGTDTGIGKTLVSAALCRLRARSGPVVYVKPVQSGAADGDDDAADVSVLAGVPTTTGPVIGPSLAPGVAARLAGDDLAGDELVEVVRTAAAAHPDAELVVEGAGGLLVELAADGTTIVDLARALQLPLLVVARPGLGTLNHTALTLAVADHRGAPVSGIVVCGYPPDPDLATRTNLGELQAASGGRLLGVIPHLPRIGPAALEAAAAWFAPELGGSWTAP